MKTLLSEAPTEKRGNDMPYQQSIERNSGLVPRLDDYRFQATRTKLQQLTEGHPLVEVYNSLANTLLEKEWNDKTRQAIHIPLDQGSIAITNDDVSSLEDSVRRLKSFLQNSL